MVSTKINHIRSRGRQRQLSALQNTVDQWNTKHPIGTVVRITNGVGVATQAPTSAPAMLLAKSTPVVWLKGIHNYVALSRVVVI
jgi:hypothetical protein